MMHIGRKCYHLVGGLGLLSLYYLLERQNALLVYGFLFLIVIVMDTLRLKIPAINQFIFDHFGSFIRTNEADKLTGTASYVLGIGISYALYRSDVATTAICFLVFGDVAATTVGERYGKTKIAGKKSLEGTLAFITAAAASGYLLQVAGIHLPSGLVMAGAAVAAATELIPLPVNDNLAIPLVSGGVMELTAVLTGWA
jgi:glycerol-3-phosphate acyltransferase PlsY